MTAIEAVYEAMHCNPDLAAMHEAYCKRHGVNSASILTVTDDEVASMVAGVLEERIKGKTVIEIGGGIGILAFHLSIEAKQVICIEADPFWTDIYLALLHGQKPKNVTFIFGAADEVAGMIKGDVSLFCTHSDHHGMGKLAAKFAPKVIDVYKDILGKDHWSITWDKKKRATK